MKIIAGPILYIAIASTVYGITAETHQVLFIIVGGFCAGIYGYLLD